MSDCLKTTFTPHTTATGNPAGSDWDSAIQNSVRALHIVSLDEQDDDLAIRINGTTIKDTQLNVAWYVGVTQTFFPPSTGTKNPSYTTTGFREIILSEADFLATLGRLPRHGDIAEIFTFDGWKGAWKTSLWQATIYWSSGRTVVVSGGFVSSGVSPNIGPAAASPGYFNGGPYFEYYIPNGKIYL